MSFGTDQSATDIHKMFFSARICFPPGLTRRARLFPCFHLLFLDDAMGGPSLSPPLASPSLPLTCPPGRVRKDGGGDPPIFDAVVGGGVFYKRWRAAVWDFHGVGCLGFPWRRLLGISFPWLEGGGSQTTKIASTIAAGRFTIENEHIHIYTALNE